MEFDDEVGFVFDLCDGGEKGAEVEHFSLFVASAAEKDSKCSLFCVVVAGFVELLWSGEVFHGVEVGVAAVFAVESAVVA